MRPRHAKFLLLAMVLAISMIAVSKEAIAIPTASITYNAEMIFPNLFVANAIVPIADVVATKRTDFISTDANHLLITPTVLHVDPGNGYRRLDHIQTTTSTARLVTFKLQCLHVDPGRK